MMTHEIICPVCEEGVLTESTFEDNFRHNGQEVHVDGLECYQCDTCGADPVFEDQIRRNHLRVADAKRKMDGLLAGKDIRNIRRQLGLTQQDAAALFGGGANAFSKYERGDVLQSAAMDKLLRLVFKYPHLISDLGDDLDIGQDFDNPTNSNDYVWQSSESAVYQSPVVTGERVIVSMADWKGKNAA